ncbi:MAG: hydroxyisourate hydrolase [Rhodobacterales bacterium]|nr:hydroxyisourate hydrolase [Rhodobacterales bacterium]
MSTPPAIPGDLHAGDACVTAHVLDLGTGRPGSGMAVTLARMYPDGAEQLACATTDLQGRLGAPLLTQGEAVAGRHLIAFDTGSAFFGTISVEFDLADPTRHHHVPLVLSPYGFSTYRGAPPHRAPDPIGICVRHPVDIPAASGAPPGTLGPGMTVHVIDIAQGTGAGGMSVELTTPSGKIRSGLITNAEGRTNDWLVGPGALEMGDYELRFDLKSYFRAAGLDTFFPRARLGFRVSRKDEHYHMPLLVSPSGYSCYRGS